MTRIVPMLVAVLLAPHAVRGQAADPLFATYEAIVEAYRSGDANARELAAAWRRADLDRIVPLTASRGGRFAQAAALLHLHLAIDRADGSWTEGAGHLDVSAALVQSLPPEDEPFTERYYAVVASLFLAHGDLETARTWIERGLQLLEFSAPVRTASGTLEEVLAHLADPECAGPGCTGGSTRTMVPERLRSAEREYRVALQRDETYVEARLRLGRVLALSNREDDAVRELRRTLESGTPRQRYLAHLFTGAIAFRRSDLATARREYEQALALSPGRQTPLIALSHLAESAGNVAQARALLMQVQHSPQAADVDPWWSYQNGGVDLETLEWLAAYVRR